MHAFGIDHGTIGEDLEDHPELGTVIRVAQRHTC